MLPRPLHHHRTSPARGIALEDLQRVDSHHEFALSVKGVKMGDERLDEQHPDDNSIEFSNDRHINGSVKFSIHTFQLTLVGNPRAYLQSPCQHPEIAQPLGFQTSEGCPPMNQLGWVSHRWDKGVPQVGKRRDDLRSHKTTRRFALSLPSANGQKIPEFLRSWPQFSF